MNSFLRDMEKKFLVLESADHCGSCDKTLEECVCETEDLDEISTTGGVAGYNVPGAFTSEKKFKKKKFTWAGGQTNESVNTPPQYSSKDERYQRPESEEEEYMDKFPFSMDENDWQHKSYEYPSKNLTDTPGTSTKKHKTLRVEDVLERKYEQLIEGYRDFATGDPKKSPEKRVKETIQEIAKKLQEIETLVNYNSKLKTEAGVTSNHYGNATRKSLHKISERLIKIAERVRSLGE